jgi:hypothetical protein
MGLMSNSIYLFFPVADNTGKDEIEINGLTKKECILYG